MISSLKMELEFMRYELTDCEWFAIRCCQISLAAYRE
jgi:hypothetical protein